MRGCGDQVGMYTLTCHVNYTGSDGERRHAPQYFKFPALNPVSVRTKACPSSLQIPFSNPLPPHGWLYQVHLAEFRILTWGDSFGLQP